jgi:hypothetical protein
VARDVESRAQSSAVPESRHGAVRHATIRSRGPSVARPPEPRMSTIEYKTILLPYKPSIFQSDNSEVQEALNIVGQEGWKLSQTILPSTLWGRSNTVMAILERAKA